MTTSHTSVLICLVVLFTKLCLNIIIKRAFCMLTIVFFKSLFVENFHVQELSCFCYVVPVTFWHVIKLSIRTCIRHYHFSAVVTVFLSKLYNYCTILSSLRETCLCSFSLSVSSKYVYSSKSGVAIIVYCLKNTMPWLCARSLSSLSWCTFRYRYKLDLIVDIFIIKHRVQSIQNWVSLHQRRRRT